MTCRDQVLEYQNHANKLVETLLELLSEALGLKPTYLKDIDITDQALFLGHYYPTCLESELTIGASNHTDDSVITILLQD